MIKLDILAIGAHPDDVELGCSATLAKEISKGKKVGVLDLTRGELGTRGSAEIRDNEAVTITSAFWLSDTRNLRYLSRISPHDTMSSPCCSSHSLGIRKHHFLFPRKIR